MSIFSETMSKAISDYRLLLRRYLGQVNRMAKLQQLGLKNPAIFENDIALYNAGHAIITDIEANMSVPDQSYYSYSGIMQFCEYLKEYLANYCVEKGCVVHRAQKASRALLQAIQLTGLPREKLQEQVTKQLLECNQVVALNGSSEQCELQLQILSRQQEHYPSFYTSIIAHLESLMHARQSQAA